MTVTTARPPFLKSLLEAWFRALDESPWSLFPYWILGTLGVGAWVAYAMPTTALAGLEKANGIAALAGLLTLNGLILALSWSAFSKIYEIVGAGQFSAFLRRNNLLGHYLLYVRYVHIAQLLAVISTGVALFSILLPFPIQGIRIVLGASVWFSLYAIRQAVAASTVMQDLIWLKAGFEIEGPKPSVREVNQSRQSE